MYTATAHPQPASKPVHQFDSGETRQLLGSIPMPPQPEIVRALLSERLSEDPDVPRIVQLISRDVGLAAAVLKAVNSPLFGLRGKVHTIQKAVALLGLKNVSNLVMGLALRASSPVQGIERFWEGSSRCALLARLLARKHASHLMDDAQLFALFHDSAIPLLLQRFPDYRETMALMAQGDWTEITALEDRRHHTNHALAGGMLAGNWGLSDNIRQAISLHHDITVFLDEKLPRDVVSLIALVHLAEYVDGLISQQTNDNAWEAFGESSLFHLVMDETDLRDFTADARHLLGGEED